MSIKRNVLAAVRSRRLTARSVLLSVLLGTDPPRLPVSVLVATTELFGIAEGTTRTALSRMATAGELRAEDGRYQLASEQLLRRQVRQAESRRAQIRDWAIGDAWVQAVVTSTGRRPADERAALRTSLQAGRLAELRQGVWLRPDNLIPEQSLHADPSVTWFAASPEADPHELVAALWDLPAWAAHADDLRRRLDGLVEPLDAGDRTVLADGFVLSAEVLRALQADPLLPPPLLPAAWPGADLRREYERYDTAYRSVLATWFAEHR
ncbi:MAG: PaaX domain-containing protein, C- domain protein [Acidimicrobiia bacterium]|nr:PaaX domain-containing protein, C- domain protein [Acidimicrobiia bacterium]